MKLTRKTVEIKGERTLEITESEFNEVAAKEEHHTAGEGAQELAGMYRVDAVHLRFHADNFAHLAGADICHQLRNIVIVAIHIADVQHRTVFSHRFDKALKIRNALASRLFHMYMLFMVSRHFRIFCKIYFFSFNSNCIFRVEVW